MRIILKKQDKIDKIVILKSDKVEKKGEKEFIFKMSI